MSPDTILIIEEIAERVANSNGAALIADYGESTHQNKLSLRVSMYECIHYVYIRSHHNTATCLWLHFGWFIHQ